MQDRREGQRGASARVCGLAGGLGAVIFSLPPSRAVSVWRERFRGSFDGRLFQRHPQSPTSGGTFGLGRAFPWGACLPWWKYALDFPTSPHRAWPRAVLETKKPGPLNRASCMSQLHTRAVLVSSPNRPNRCRRPRLVASPMQSAPKSSTSLQPILGRVRRRRTTPVRSDGEQRTRDCGRTVARQRPIDQQTPIGQSLVDR